MKHVRLWMIAGALAMAGCGQPAAPPAEEQTSTPPATEQETTQVAAAPAPTSEEKASEVLTVEDVFVLPADDGKPLDLDTIREFLDNPKNHETIVPVMPVGLPPLDEYIPKDNPLTRAKIELGRLLYFDPRLSADNSVSCASCHDPATGWAQNTPVAAGIGGQLGGRNSPTVMNRAFGKTQFWDGRADSLEDQSLGPIQNPIEMGFTLEECNNRLNEVEGYRLFFEKVFGSGCDDKHIAQAIAAFERMVVTAGAPYDYHTRAEAASKLSPEEIAELDPETKAEVEKLLADKAAHPMSEAAQRGMALYFGKAQCSLCHVGVNLTDELFYNIGVGMDKENPDLGRYVVTNNEADKGAFKTPSLRNIALTAPYMHDGSQKTLMEVVEFYNKGGHPNPHLHERIKKLNLTKEEMEDLVAFMEQGLSSPLPNIPKPRLPE